MTGWNLPDGCNVSDLPGNSKSACEQCEGEHWAEDMHLCDTCELLFCDDCWPDHASVHEDDDEKVDD